MIRTAGVKPSRAPASWTAWDSARYIVMGTQLLVTGEDLRLVRFSIAQDPPHMLDGPYVVHFGEESAQVERKGCLWIWAGA